MQPIDPLLARQLPVIQKIIQDETWLEGERRGCHVPPSDRVVRARVCEIVIRVGQQLRDSLSIVGTTSGVMTARVGDTVSGSIRLTLPEETKAA